MFAFRETACRLRVRGWQASLGILGGILASLILIGSSWLHRPEAAIPSDSPTQRFPLDIIPNPLSLGILKPHQGAEADGELHNPGSREIVVENVETSCGCVVVNPRSLRLAPGETTSLKAAFDPSHDPEFRGRLAVQVVGHGPGNTIVFQTIVNLEVRTD
ncbi:DUF1573 domain-containing protein [Singulisphaera sp. PoT]|uniref:DUF1573 domain-containing protein n=1 Tax=Singulisphaera sp. PoT TaxID=3411797 RepID=UPI003BF5C9E3